MTTEKRNFAPPAMNRRSVERLRASIAEEARLVLVEWYDPRTVTEAPWDMWCQPEDMAPGVCVSVGFAYDHPEERAVLIRPHLVECPFEDDADWNDGEIVIPYSSIRSVHPLAGGEAEFNCFRDRTDAMNGTRATAARGNS